MLCKYYYLISVNSYISIQLGNHMQVFTAMHFELMDRSGEKKIRMEVDQRMEAVTRDNNALQDQIQTLRSGILSYFCIAKVLKIRCHCCAFAP